jgi:N-acetylglutamate synthase-like GNAT family acetyltransferase
MTEEVLPNQRRELGTVTESRTFRRAESADVAELSRLVRARPKDCIDPFPPASDLEVLADAGARGKGSPRHPLVIDGEEGVVAYGALDYSDDLHRAQLVGPIVHPAHRRRGCARVLVEGLIAQARVAKQTELRATVGGMNQAARVMLENCGFKTLACNTLLRIDRPASFGEVHMDGVSIRRATYDDGEIVHEFVRKLVPRSPKQTRSLLKTSEYIVLLAARRGSTVGFAEVDLRQPGIASLEHLDGPPNMLHKGLGNLLLFESVRAAFENPAVQHFDLVTVGNDPRVLTAYIDAGFEQRHDLLVYELKL